MEYNSSSALSPEQLRSGRLGVSEDCADWIPVAPAGRLGARRGGRGLGGGSPQSTPGAAAEREIKTMRADRSLPHRRTE